MQLVIRSRPMKRILVLSIIVVAVIASAAGYQRGSHWKEYKYPGTRLMADLREPDALIRTASLARLPRDLLKVPIARDVLTEELAFYYEQHEDRLGLKGAVRRIAYEHQLDWTDHLIASALDEPAEIALWRDGHGALRHFAIVMRRNSLSKVIQEAGTVALKDRQLKRAGMLPTREGQLPILALATSPRRTFLLIARGERIVVLSDPGLLFGRGAAIDPASAAAVAEWLEDDGALSRHFALDKDPSSTHTLVVGAPTLALGYGSFLSGFKAMRFDFGATWSTALWIDPPSAATWGDAALWRAAPANPGACVALPFDWREAGKVVVEADHAPDLPRPESLAALEGSVLACWYRQSSLYSPVFIAKLSHNMPDRDRALEALAAWAISRPVAKQGGAPVWRAADAKTERRAPTLAARGPYVVFSPDGTLVELALDTIARRNPSVADQVPASSATLALITPRPLSAMAEAEAFAALAGPGDANLLAAAQTHLPARMKALAAYPPYRLELTRERAQSGWVRVEWRTPEERK